MATATAFNSAKCFCCNSRNSGSRISGGETTCAQRRLAESMPASNSILRISQTLEAIGWVGDAANIGDERLQVSLFQSISVRRHLRRLIQGRSAKEIGRASGLRG